MVEYPIPRIPSNLAATKAIPGSDKASAKVWSVTHTPAIHVVSIERNPAIVRFVYNKMKFGLRGFSFFNSSRLKPNFGPWSNCIKLYFQPLNG